MAYDGKIYELNDSAIEGQPYLSTSETNWTWIGKQTEENPWGDWEELAMTFPEGVDTVVSKKLYFIIKHPQALEWDYYGDNGGGTNGLISQRAKDLLGDYLRTCSNFLQTAINDQPYYYLLKEPRKTLDCWDRENSVCEISDIIKSRVAFRKIERLSFFRDQLTDPMAFRIPEYFSILVTEGIKQMIEDAKLNGFEFVDCDDMLWSRYR